MFRVKAPNNTLTFRQGAFRNSKCRILFIDLNIVSDSGRTHVFLLQANLATLDLVQEGV